MITHLNESEPQPEDVSRLIQQNIAGLVKQTQRQANNSTLQNVIIAGLVVAVVSLSLKVWTIHYTNVGGGIQSNTVGKIDELSLKDFARDAILIMGNLSKQTARDRYHWALAHMEPQLKSQFQAAMEGKQGQLQRIETHNMTLDSYDLSHQGATRIKRGRRPIYEVITRVTQLYQVGSIPLPERRVDTVFHVQPSLAGEGLQMVYFNFPDFYTREGKPVDVLLGGDN